MPLVLPVQEDDGAGGGTGTLSTIRDEGAVVDAACTNLNFVGVGVTATAMGGGVVDVTIPGGGVAAAKGRLTVTAAIAAGVNFSTIASGAGYTQSGDPTSLGISQVAFRATHTTCIQINGVELDKETEILWVNSQTFQLINLAVDTGDILTIYN